MARRRMIDPNIWQSESFSKISLLAKLVFIGLVSNADDEGRGKSNPVYIKSILFPYDDGMRVIDIEKALLEIGQNLSVTLYDHDGSKYYALDHWNDWQTIDRPKPSKIPLYCDSQKFDDESTIDRRCIDEASSLKEKREKKEKEKIRSKEESADAPDPFCDFSPLMQDALQEWMKYKTERREGYKPTGLKNFIATIKNKLQCYQEDDVISLIRECMSNGWSGIIWDKLEKKGGNGNVGKHSSESSTGNQTKDEKPKYGKYV